MSRKDFNLIARVILETYQEEMTAQGAQAMVRLTERFAQELKQTNPSFQPERFISAALWRAEP